MLLSKTHTLSSKIFWLPDKTILFVSVGKGWGHPQSHMLSKPATDSSNCEIRCCSFQIQSSWNSLSLPRWAEVFDQTILVKKTWNKPKTTSCARKPKQTEIMLALCDIKQKWPNDIVFFPCLNVKTCNGPLFLFFFLFSTVHINPPPSPALMLRKVGGNLINPERTCWKHYFGC